MSKSLDYYRRKFEERKLVNSELEDIEIDDDEDEDDEDFDNNTNSYLQINNSFKLKLAPELQLEGSLTL